MATGMRIGYARVSSSGQKLDVQLDRLADCDRVFHEKVSGKSTKGRPELKNALDFVRVGDVFVVTKLDRLARSVVDLAGIWFNGDSGL
jgi:DNA invertase Pin-like site-specific DNA recombinase